MKKIPPNNLEYILDIFQNVYPISWKRLFGGFGLFYNDTMVAIFIKDVLYLKSTVDTKNIFEAKHLKQFSYQAKGKIVFLKYYQAPDIIYDDMEEATYWLNLAKK